MFFLKKIILYNGSKKWNIPRNICDLIDTNIPDRFIPSYQYYAIIQNEITQDQLDKISNLVAAVIRLENAGDEKKLRVAVDAVIQYISNENIVDVGIFWKWLNAMFKHELSGTDLAKIHDVMEVRPMLSEVVEQIEKKGEQRGIREGKVETARIMLKKGYQLTEISELTGLTIQEIEKL